MSKEDRLKVKEAMKIAYEIRDPNTAIVNKNVLMDRLQRIYAKNPRVQRAIDGVDQRGGLIELFEHVKKRYQDSLRERARIELSPLDNQLIDQLLVSFRSGMLKSELKGQAKDFVFQTCIQLCKLRGSMKRRMDTEPGISWELSSNTRSCRVS